MRMIEALGGTMAASTSEAAVISPWPTLLKNSSATSASPPQAYSVRDPYMHRSFDRFTFSVNRSSVLARVTVMFTGSHQNALPRNRQIQQAKVERGASGTEPELNCLIQFCDLY